MIKRIEFSCAAILLVAIVILVGIAAAMRAIGTPVIWSIEVAQLLFLWLCIVAIDLGLQHERHFGVGLISDNLPPMGRKILQAGNLMVLVGLLVFLLQFAWRNVAIMHTRLDGALQMPGSWYHASILVGFLLMLRTLVVRLLHTVRGPAEP